MVTLKGRDGRLSVDWLKRCFKDFQVEQLTPETGASTGENAIASEAWPRLVSG